ncbi:MAG TPA: CDP-alcohol phosphatidyltransferase family protein [Anaerolineales bacterium]|nr:CDP-alcohol phosphatidyltransferase family protein [Anaerolineales bacterium]
MNIAATNTHFRSLQREAIWLFIVSWLPMSFFVLFSYSDFVRWLLGCLPAFLWLVWQNWQLWRQLHTNHPPAGGELFPNLGLANWISSLRAPLLVYGWSLGMLRFQQANIPWLAYAVSGCLMGCWLLDNLDGWVARAMRRTTLLGQRLDGSMDATCIGLGSLLAWLWGQVGVWYLWVGLAKPLYDLGLWWHRRVGKLVLPLPPSDARRTQAGVQMAFISFILLTPVWYPPATLWASLAFAIPFLSGFLRDFAVVTGRMAWRFAPANGSLPNLPRWLSAIAFLTRIATVFLSLWLLRSSLGEPFPPNLFWAIVLGLLAILQLLGFATRLVALCILVWVGIWTHGTLNAPLPYWAMLAHLLLLVASTYLGGGWLSAWSPEKGWLNLRAGETKPTGKR